MARTKQIRVAALITALLIAVSVTAIACGSNDDSDETIFSGLQEVRQSGDGEQSDAPSVGAGSISSSQATVTAGGSIAPAPTTVPRPAATPTAAAAEPPRGPAGQPGPSGSDDLSLEQSPLNEQQPQVGQQRVIIRNVDMSIEAPDVSTAIEEISTLTTQRGGWVVKTQNVEVHRGSVDIRVPADQLDQVLAEIRNIASKVVSEISTSQDFTEEFTDTTARIQTLQDTVDALRSLYSRAEKIEDALTIQREITRIQADIESMQARINFLSQSAAFSLVKVTVLALPQEVEVDAGQDILAAVGRQVRFRAEFTPPEGIDNLQVEWDFGDGTARQTVTRVAPVNVEGRVISAPVVHTYGDDTDSPYIVKVIVKGTGESGAAEGEDVIVVTVNRVPPIEVFAGENLRVDEGEKVTLRGSFTRPEGVENLRYTWDFGDGTAPVTVNADPGTTVATVEHTYANSRPQTYKVVLTVKGETAAGTTEGTGSMQVLVEEPESLTAGGFAPGDSSRSAVRTLSAIGSGVGTALIWIGILSPLWLVIALIGYLVYRNSEKSRNRRTSKRLAAENRQSSSDG